MSTAFIIYYSAGKINCYNMNKEKKYEKSALC